MLSMGLMFLITLMIPITFYLVQKLLTDEGVLILEFPDLDQLFKKKSFDTIYHEHRNYYSKILSLKFLKK